MKFEKLIFQQLCGDVFANFFLQHMISQVPCSKRFNLILENETSRRIHEIGLSGSEGRVREGDAAVRGQSEERHQQPGAQQILLPRPTEGY